MTTDSATGAGGLEARPPANRERTPAEIEADIERTREQLAGNIDAISDRLKPANLFQRAVESIKAKFVDEDGNPRPDRIAVVAVVAAAVVGLVVWRRRR